MSSKECHNGKFARFVGKTFLLRLSRGLRQGYRGGEVVDIYVEGDDLYIKDNPLGVNRINNLYDPTAIIYLNKRIDNLPMEKRPDYRMKAELINSKTFVIHMNQPAEVEHLGRIKYVNGRAVGRYPYNPKK